MLNFFFSEFLHLILIFECNTHLPEKELGGSPFASIFLERL